MSRETRFLTRMSAGGNTAKAFSETLSASSASMSAISSGSVVRLFLLRSMIWRSGSLERMVNTPPGIPVNSFSRSTSSRSPCRCPIAGDSVTRWFPERSSFTTPFVWHSCLGT